jgi:hypothetical protein
MTFSYGKSISDLNPQSAATGVIEVDMWKQMCNLTGDLVARICFTEDLGLVNGSPSEAGQAYTVLHEMGALRNALFFLPILKYPSLHLL